MSMVDAWGERVEVEDRPARLVLTPQMIESARLEQARTMKEAGCSVRTIAAFFNVGVATAHSWVGRN